jgi:hypothetical protein
MAEIITDDNNVIFFQSQERGLAKLRKYEEGLDVVHIEILCQNINFSVNDFIKLCEKYRVSSTAMKDIS